MESETNTPPPAPPATPARSPVRILWTTALSLLLVLAAGLAAAYAGHRLGLDQPDGRVFQFLAALPLVLIGIVIVEGLRLGRAQFLLVVLVGAGAAVGGFHYFAYRAFPREWGEQLEFGLTVWQCKQLQRIDEEIARRRTETLQLFDQLLPKVTPEKQQALRKLRNAQDQTFQKWRRVNEPVRKLAQATLTDQDRERQVQEYLRGFREDVGIPPEVRLPARDAGDTGPGDGSEVSPARLTQELKEHSDAQAALLDEFGTRLNAMDEEIQLLGQWQTQLSFPRYLDLKARQGFTVGLFGYEWRFQQESAWLYWLFLLLFTGLVMGGIVGKVHQAVLGKDAPAPSPPPRPPGRCPRCGAALKSPRARQCFSCGHDWHEKREQTPPASPDPEEKTSGAVG